MDSKQILEMITSNRKYIRLKSNIAVQNLAMLHRSFDSVDDDECQLSLRLNDCYASAVFGSDYVSAILAAEDILERYAGTKHIQLVAEYESLMGRCYTYLTQYEAGREHLLKAEAIAFGRLPDSEEVRGLQADVLHNLAMNQHHTGMDEDITIAYLYRALEVLEDTGHSNRKGICLMGLGNVLSVQNEMEDALRYYLQAEVYFEDAQSTVNLSTVYSNISICHIHLENFEEAETYVMRSLDMRTRLGSYWEIANSYYTLATLHRKQGDIEKAYQHLLISRDYAMVSQAVGVQSMILQELEDLSMKRGDIVAAEEYRSCLGEIQRVAA